MLALMLYEHIAFGALVVITSALIWLEYRSNKRRKEEAKRDEGQGTQRRLHDNK